MVRLIPRPHCFLSLSLFPPKTHLRRTSSSSELHAPLISPAADIMAGERAGGSGAARAEKRGEEVLRPFSKCVPPLK
jgi:hypothetical protein